MAETPLGADRMTHDYQQVLWIYLQYNSFYSKIKFLIYTFWPHLLLSF